jgi:tetratricopeptide (TPR) repeat protein
MTVLRVASALLLFLPVACSGSPAPPRPPSAEEEDKDGPRDSDPKDAEGYVKRGDDYADEREYDKAIADYKEAMRLAPEEAEAYWSAPQKPVQVV